jgi:hypothetical protein
VVGIVPVVWATTEVDATTAITLAIAATRKLRIMAAPLGKGSVWALFAARPLCL